MRARLQEIVEVLVLKRPSTTRPLGISFAWFYPRFVLAMIKTKGCLKKANANR